MKSDYDTQADSFLQKHGLKFRAVLKNTKAPGWDTPQPMKKCESCKGRGERFASWPFGRHQTQWEFLRKQNMPIYTPCGVCHGEGEVPDLEAPKHGNHYHITLSQGRQRRLSFDFWGSIRDKEDGKHPTAYDVISCISGDLHTPVTFDDFCAEYGYSTDSRETLATWERCLTFSRRLKAFFTSEKRAELSEIQ